MADEPIIKVDVDDEKFRNFYALFESYSSKLEDMPAEWKRVQKALDAATHSLSSTLNASHSRGFIEGAAEMRKLAQGLDRSVVKQRILTHEVSRTATIFRSVTEASGGFLDNVTEGAGVLAVMSKSAGRLLGKFGIPLALVGGSIAAVEKIGELTMRQRFASRLLGTNIGTARAFSNVYQGVIPNPSHFAEGLAVSAINPQQAAAFSVLGISPTAAQSMDKVKLAELTLRRARAFTQRYRGYALQTVAQSSGLTGLIPMSELIMLQNMKGTDFAKLEQQVRHRAPYMNVTRQHARHVIGAMKSLQYRGGELETVFANSASGAITALNNFARALRRNIDALEGKVSPTVKRGLTGPIPSVGTAGKGFLYELGKNGPAALSSAWEGLRDLLVLSHKSRAYNFGNLKDAKTGKFLAFPNLHTGAVALDMQLRLDILKYHQNTLRKLIYGDSEHGGYTATDRAAYLRNLARFTGYGPDEPITARSIPKLMAGIARQETGARPSPSTMRALLGEQASLSPNRPDATPRVSVRVHNSTAARVAVSGAQAAGPY